ncbi:hypothetical protein OOT33_13995 [Sphingobium sp. DEHP117]|uniref:aldose epimerase family protein n=1 Tax=Sphingobium sp. DEHP117 TaxID=2993436 RepID=UPI0027D49057|nr:hypothetical protein [Sphingobium sp. DEHP117]MDQ4421535.1 hypothetical protein [Sphingobium sp. DEHP117]
MPAIARCYDVDRNGPLVELRPERDRLSAVIAPGLGGALVGLSVKSKGISRELLYRGMDFCPHQGWDGKAPILWPATGRNFDKAVPGGQGWSWQGRPLPMPIHGFARDMAWRVVSHSANRDSAAVTLRLTDTASTLVSYPFGFEFTITYQVTGSLLLIRHKIVASPRNETAMPFSIGNHITFRQPLAGQGTMTLTTSARKRILLDPSGRPTGIARQPKLVRYPVAALGREKALPLADFPQSPSVRLDDSSGLKVTLSHYASGNPTGQPVLFNLWGNAEAGFFSPEPWVGRQNSLSDRKGLIMLPPGRTFTWLIKIRVDG